MLFNSLLPPLISFIIKIIPNLPAPTLPAKHSTTESFDLTSVILTSAVLQISNQQLQSMARSHIKMHSSAAAALVAMALLVVPTASHSWVQELDVIDPKTGYFTGTPGYCRNNSKQTSEGFSDPLMVRHFSWVPPPFHSLPLPDRCPLFRFLSTISKANFEMC